MQFTLADLHNCWAESFAWGRCPRATATRRWSAALPSIAARSSRTKFFGDWKDRGSTAAHFAEEAFIRGAAGVVASGRRVEPWAGRWVLEVEDSRHVALETRRLEPGAIQRPAGRRDRKRRQDDHAADDRHRAGPPLGRSRQPEELQQSRRRAAQPAAVWSGGINMPSSNWRPARRRDRAARSI